MLDDGFKNRKESGRSYYKIYKVGVSSERNRFKIL